MATQGGKPGAAPTVPPGLPGMPSRPERKLTPPPPPPPMASRASQSRIPAVGARPPFDTTEDPTRKAPMPLPPYTAGHSPLPPPPLAAAGSRPNHAALAVADMAATTPFGPSIARAAQAAPPAAVALSPFEEMPSEDMPLELSPAPALLDPDSSGLDGLLATPSRMPPARPRLSSPLPPPPPSRPARASPMPPPPGLPPANPWSALPMPQGNGAGLPPPGRSFTPMPPSALSESLMRKAGVAEIGHLETETITKAKLRGLKRGRRLPWLLFVLAAAVIATMVSLGMEERQRLDQELRAAKQAEANARMTVDKAEKGASALVQEREEKIKQLEERIEEQEKAALAKTTLAGDSVALLARLKAGLPAKEAEIGAQGNAITMNVPARLLFNGASAEIGLPGFRLLARIGKLLAEIKDAKLVIAGHTDKGRPPGKAGFASNWELSSARAVAVLRYLTDEAAVPAAQLSAAAHAEYSPRGKRGGNNQRIEIRIETTTHAAPAAATPAKPRKGR